MISIDLVYTWFNSSDPDQVVTRAKFAQLADRHEHIYSTGEARFANNGELTLSIDNACRFLPFVRNIYVVCGGLPPSWLTENPRVSVIDVDEIIPSQISPTYQSDLIEAYVYRIPGLSERYLYSNDDMFFAETHAPGDFFTDDGKLSVAVCERYVGLGPIDEIFRAREINAARALRRKLDLKPPVSVGGSDLRSFARRLRGRFQAHRASIPFLNTTTHVTQPFLRSGWDGFHALFAPEIDELTADKFRTVRGYPVNTMYHHYMRSIDLAEFAYDPSHVYFDRRQPAEQREDFLKKIVNSDESVRRFCLNDAPGCSDDGWEDYIATLLGSLKSPDVDAAS